MGWGIEREREKEKECVREKENEREREGESEGDLGEQWGRYGLLSSYVRSLDEFSLCR